MKKLMALTVLAVLISGCVTIKIPMADLVGTFEATEKINKKVLLVFPADFNKAQYQSKQLATTYDYPLGTKTENYIEECVRGYFVKVDKSTDDANKALYDIVIKPELVNFEAKVPATIFEQTVTQVNIKLIILDIVQKNEIELVSSGTQKLVTDEEKNYRSEKIKNSPWRRAETPNLLIEAKRYENLAAADAEMAFLHCLNNLMEQLIAKLNLDVKVKK